LGPGKLFSIEIGLLQRAICLPLNKPEPALKMRAKNTLSWSVRFFYAFPETLFVTDFVSCPNHGEQAGSDPFPPEWGLKI
jgi:hypothetical protein